MTEPLTPEASANLIFDTGPLTRAELKRLSNDKAYEYFQLMHNFVNELGAEAFLARRDEIRQAVLRKIVNRR